jgi:hypothetical protein
MHWVLTLPAPSAAWETGVRAPHLNTLLRDPTRTFLRADRSPHQRYPFQMI